MPSSGLTPVFGGGGINPGSPWGETDNLKVLFAALKEGGCSHIDTAALYGESERILGEMKAGDQFTIDTKTKGGFGGKGYATKDCIVKEGENSKEKLGCNVDIYYIHAPDGETDINETLEGINETYKKGFFKRFGLSNYKAEDVEKITKICEEKGYPKPTVYQGNYNPVARKQETMLFPTLRKLGIAFYVYSPIAGGFLTKKREDIEAGVGRFNKEAIGGLYSRLYNKPKYLDALGLWEKVAKEEGVSEAELAYRWVTFNSPLDKKHGDAIIFGASKMEQVKQTLGYINAGPLSEKALKGIDEVWKTIEHEAPLDNYHM